MVGCYLGALGLSVLLFATQRRQGRRRALLAALPVGVLTTVGLTAVVLAALLVVALNADCDRTPGCRSDRSTEHGLLR